MLSESAGSMTEWVTAISLLCIGVAILFRRRLVKIYIVSELLLGVVTTLFITVMILGGHAVLSGLPLIGTILLFVIFTCIPICLAIRLLLADRNQ